MIDTIPHPANNRTIEMYPEFDERLDRIYANNIQTLSVVNRSRGVKTVFIGQLLNKWILTSEKSYGWLPFVADKDVWATQLIFNKILKDRSKALNDLYIDINIDLFQKDDFHDQGHFSRSGAEKFARVVAKEIYEYCR